MAHTHVNDSVHWYMSELTSRVVAKSGITSDRFHIGKIMLQSFGDDPNFVSQIDGGTGESETNGSLMKRSIRCAISLKKLGMKQGDVMIFMAPNHLDLAVPFCAAMYLGIIAAPVDRRLTIYELQNTFGTLKPNIILCQCEKVLDIQAALKSLNIKSRIITFDGLSYGSSFADLLQVDEESVIKFNAEDFNAEESIAAIIPTSGTTGFPKGVTITHKTCMIVGPHLWSRHTEFPTPTRMRLVLSPLQWVSAVNHFIMAPILKYTRLQTSQLVTQEHARCLINTYRPTVAVLTAPFVTELLKPAEQGPCDFSSFDTIMIGGTPVSKDVMEAILVASPRTTVINVYGMCELAGAGFIGNCPIESCGKPSVIFKYRLVDMNTKVDIQEPNVPGELWVKGPAMFKDYYNNPEATKEAFTEDRWFKTGDLFYRDEHWNFYFVGRINLLLTDTRNCVRMTPTEIEAVIRQHPGVLDAAVVGLPDPECGDLPVGCVIPRPGHCPTAQEIKDLVKEKLSVAKQLRGGVVFMDAFPLTATAKINYRELSNIVRSTKLQ